MSERIHHHCSCCGSHMPKGGSFSRRTLLLGSGVAAAVGSLTTGRGQVQAASAAEPSGSTLAPASKLVVQPVLVFALAERKEKTSWRSWCGIQTAAQLAEEQARIDRELKEMAAAQNLAVEFLPLATVASPQESAKVAENKYDAVLIYWANHWSGCLEPLLKPDRPSLFFLRHRSGPIYLGYEIMHPRMLRKDTDAYDQPGVDIHDVVVDDYAELAWRLKALTGLRRTLGQRIVTIGGARGWGRNSRDDAPRIAREKWRLDIQDVTYDDLGRRIEKAKTDSALVADARKQAADYLSNPTVKLLTEKKYVENGFLLATVFKQILDEHACRAITINECMTTIMPMADTTACITLSVLNDSGYLAFCESDFVVIPAGLLMHHIMGTPVFLNDPTWPHNGEVTIAHCTAPRKMDGKTLEPAEIMTHFESDFGAAPKVAMRIGQVVTNVIPDFDAKKWVGFTGKVKDNPFMDICRSQSEISIDGDWQRLLAEMRGFHWMTIYGDCLREVGYAIKRVGIEWENVSA